MSLGTEITVNWYFGFLDWSIKWALRLEEWEQILG